MKVLGIETSCDETGIAIYDDKIGLIANKIYSQKKIHKKYGGIVPELASREHIKKTIQIVKSIFLKNKISQKEINAIAYTSGPGLIGPLIVGSSIAYSLSYAWKIPSIAINHLEGHIMASMLCKKKPNFPFIALLVSGGHTQIIYVKNIGKYKLLGETVDDAAGEAFDKTAKLLGLGYPGGKKLSIIAKQGIHGKFIFPQPMIKHNNLNFSFSGLKTSAKIKIQNHNINQQTIANIAYAFEEAITDVLVKKSKKALIQTQCKQLAIVGGVGANSKLRAKMKKEIQKIKGKIFYPNKKFCTDNGAMIAITGMMRLKKKLNINTKLNIRAKWPISDIK